MSKITITFLAAICLITILPGCNKDYLEKYPLSGPSSASFYSNQDELMMGLYGCYQQLNYGNGSLRLPWHIFIDAVSDICWERTNGALQDLGKGAFDVNNDIVLLKWRETYKGIGRCNFLLDNIDRLKDKIPANLFNQVKAEARFIRALHYHYLLTLFGDVPLITTGLSLEASQVERTKKEEVVDFILKEMTEAAVDLPLNQDAMNNGRATKGAALAFKARTALYHAKWDMAAQAAQEVMNLNKYQLHTNFGELFRYAGASSREIILSLQYKKTVVTHTTPRYFLSRLPGGVCDKVPLQSFIDTYEARDGLSIDKSPLYNPARPYDNRDPRLGMTVALPGTVLFGFNFETHKDSLTTWNYNTTPATRVANTDATHAFATFTGYVWRKYCDEVDRADNQNSELPIILMRYAEVLLIYAEAKIELNQIDNSVYAAINAVRQRPTVLMPVITPGKTQAEMRSAVRKERKYEFAMEGLRLADIRRWKIAEQVMNGPVYGRVPRGLLSNPPVIDANGTPNYSNVTNRADMRLIETKIFNAGRDYLFPIPGIEILTNKKLVQNPGY
ncbi:RagB/SusD family nutrient uptake outer membrane protein [Segetibacter sp. 3557_3]|uniref:RagB/SusD family nutrient uptake outer membrane protein n=1 Tax=Segetibacter sp. 3557_3 TaxID=2547429 RepID=UPI00105892D6|nr:RagB/SusD family nutrient uptake outer membrane protein [Segetibacter sp. 3557_3]TDH28644.1 RagB/SusD family nutrient uptake outer membrane protein [Segetibacter sp. 3557_3]